MVGDTETWSYVFWADNRLEGKPLFESTVICEFLEEAYPDHKPNLLPEDVYLRARTRIWTDYVTSRIIPSFHRFLQWQPMDDKDGLAEARNDLVAKFREFTLEMDDEGPFFFGKEPSLIDFVVAPWIVSLMVAWMRTLAKRCD